MKFLKKLFLWFFVPVILVGASVFVFEKLHPERRLALPFVAAKPCGQPLKFAIGSADPRFSITSDHLKDIAMQAADVWNKAAGRQVLEYDPNASLKIDLTYDQRQQESDAAGQLDADLQVLSSQRAALDKQYGGLDKQYNQELADFKSGVADYEKQVADYNQEVDRWNSQGGAPQNVYDKLNSEKKDLDSTLGKLQSQEKDLNALAKKINGLAVKEKSAVNSYNSEVATFQSEYGGSQEFEKGVFDSSKGITIYQFKADDDLRMTIAHELGHALGMDHVQNPKSIMYYLMQDQDLKNPAPTAEDMAELKTVCQLN